METAWMVLTLIVAVIITMMVICLVTLIIMDIIHRREINFLHGVIVIMGTLTSYALFCSAFEDTTKEDSYHYPVRLPNGVTILIPEEFTSRDTFYIINIKDTLDTNTFKMIKK